MIVWVTKESVNMPCDQRAEIITVRNRSIYVILCGTGLPALVSPGEVCGVEITENLIVKFDVKRTEWRNET